MEVATHINMFSQFKRLYPKYNSKLCLSSNKNILIQVMHILSHVLGLLEFLLFFSRAGIFIIQSGV